MPGHSFLPYRGLSSAVDPFALRVTQLRPLNPRGRHILYHARSARRAKSNLALDFAETFGLPVIMIERLDEPHLSPRTEAFIRARVERTRGEAAARGVRYLFEPEEDFTADARAVITDEFPTLPLPPYATHVVDQNGLLPMRAMAKEQYSAKFFRDRAHRLLPDFFRPSEGVEPLALDGYAANRNKTPRATTHLSAALHFGHVSIQDVASAALFSDAANDDVDSFLEEAVIRRELSFNLCFYNPRHASLDALPEWAKRTLDRHRRDRRKPFYSYEELERAATHDDVWNLAQQQLVACGTIHGYLRMLWGKKIIEWSETPEAAHEAMVRLHDVYALDGRDPNTHAGILWCFGKHDRPWAPERPIFGTIRWMSSEQTAKKVRLRDVEALVNAARAASARIPAAS